MEEKGSMSNKLLDALVLDSDKDLSGFRRGRELLFKELKALPDGSVVWVTCHLSGERAMRANGAFRIKGQSDGSWELEDGSSFGAEFYPEDLVEDSPCVDEMEGEGELCLFRAEKKKAGK